MPRRRQRSLLLTVMIEFLWLAAAALAFWNGANDVSRGVATLVGAGAARPRTAIFWGAIWTAAGAGSALWLAGSLFQQFVAPEWLSGASLGATEGLIICLGAVAWLIVATGCRLPVSTTHSMIGAMLAVGLLTAGPAGVAWLTVAAILVIPLAFSPLIAAGLVTALAPLWRRTGNWLHDACVCVVREEPVRVQPSIVSAATAANPYLQVQADSRENCERIAGVPLRFNLLTMVHWASAATVSFARGSNDAPKILGVALIAGAVAGHTEVAGLFLITFAMFAGSIVAGFRVTDTLAYRITSMSNQEACAANIVTGALVTGASHLGLPVSTTHVNCGAIFGTGLSRGTGALQWGMVRRILSAWIVTVPGAAAATAALWVLITQMS